MSALPLAGQVSVVTGGGSGIGRAVCHSLAERGSTVVVVDVDGDGIDETRRTTPGTSVAAVADVRDEEAVAGVMDHCVHVLGGLDVLVCCAGILRAGGIPRTVAELGTAEWDAVVSTNLTGTFVCNRAAARHMVRARHGQIVNVSSMSGLRGRAFDGAYCASKFGVIGLSEALAEEVRRHRVRVQTVLPDVVATPLWDQNGILPPPADALSPERVGEVVALLVCLPDDVLMVNPVLARFSPSRR